MQIPFVRLLQALSPQLNKKKAEYIEGASAGDAFNNVTSQHWDGEKGVTVIPCFQTTKYLEFVPRDMGGGYKGEIPANSPLLQQTTRSGSKEILPSGNELVKSDQHFCLIVEEDGSFQPAGGRHEVDPAQGQPPLEDTDRHAEGEEPEDRCAMVTPPVFATMWRLYSVEESNDQGSWGNWQVERIGLVENRDLLLEAKAFRDSIAAGEVKAAPETGQTMGGAANDGDEIPF
jgi:hypothetical protein